MVFKQKQTVANQTTRRENRTWLRKFWWRSNWLDALPNSKMKNIYRHRTSITELTFYTAWQMHNCVHQIVEWKWEKKWMCTWWVYSSKWSKTKAKAKRINFVFRLLFFYFASKMKPFSMRMLRVYMWWRPETTHRSLCVGMFSKKIKYTYF